MADIQIYVASICNSMKGKDGVYAAILRYGQHEKVITGFVEYTTPNQIELIAVLEAAKMLNVKGKSKAIEVYCTNDYVIHGFNDNLSAWKANGWQTTRKKTIKNKAQWKALNHCKELFPRIHLNKGTEDMELIKQAFKYARAQGRESNANGANV